MNFIGRRTATSLLLVFVTMLALTSMSPANAVVTTLTTVLGTTKPSSVNAHTEHTQTNAHTWQASSKGNTGQAQTNAHTWQAPTSTHSRQDHSPAHTWQTTSHAWTHSTVQDPVTRFAHTWNGGTRSWSNTWSNTWSRTWSRTWSTTWSRRTHVYPTYTTTEYVPVQIPSCDPYSCYDYGNYYGIYPYNGYYPLPSGCDPTNPSCYYAYNGYYQPPIPACDPNNSYCNSNITPYPPPPQPTVPGCDPNNPYCNPSLLTMTTYAPQTVASFLPASPTTATYQPLPQIVPVPQPQSYNYTLIAIAIIIAAAVAIILLSRGQETPTQPPQSKSIAQTGFQFCQHCGKQIASNMPSCKFCGSTQ